LAKSEIEKIARATFKGFFFLLLISSEFVVEVKTGKSGSVYDSERSSVLADLLEKEAQGSHDAPSARGPPLWS